MTQEKLLHHKNESWYMWYKSWTSFRFDVSLTIWFLIMKNHKIRWNFIIRKLPVNKTLIKSWKNWHFASFYSCKSCLLLLCLFKSAFTYEYEFIRIRRHPFGNEFEFIRIRHVNSTSESLRIGPLMLTMYTRVTSIFAFEVMEYK